ncbi:hypothetical protein D3C87_1568870 [compost metagenome]
MKLFLNIPLIRRLVKPGKRLLVILWYALTFVVHHPQVELCLVMLSVSRLAKPGQSLYDVPSVVIQTSKAGLRLTMIPLSGGEVVALG